MKISTALLMTVFALCFTAPASAESKPLPEQHIVKANLKKLGYLQPWIDSQGASRMEIDSGEVWLSSSGVFAEFPLADKSEEQLQNSFINSVTTCAEIGMAITGERSNTGFSQFGVMAGTALQNVDTEILEIISDYPFHFMVKILDNNQAVMRCGVRK